MFIDLLVATTGQGDDAAAVATAAALVAGVEHGHVAVLVQLRVPLPDGGMGFVPADAFLALHAQMHADAVAECDRWRDALRRGGTPGEVRLVDDVISSRAETAVMQAHYADLAIVGLGARGELPLEVHDQVARLLTGSGRPVLAVPPGCEGIGTGVVVIGWRPGAAATRAVHDAMPLLSKARSVHVVCIDPRRGEKGHGDDPGADIARHLARHGLPVTVHVAAGAGDEPGEVLLRRARELGAGVVVMGGYGRSRLREWLLGGTTRHVLKHADVPVLLAH